jgi:hypothetical protein
MVFPRCESTISRFGPEGAVTIDIIAVVDGRLIKILVEPVAQAGGTAVDGSDVLG